MIGKTPFALALLLAAGLDMHGAGQAFARGGAPNLINSPGYQRALEESRKRYRESTTQPYKKPPAAHPRKKSRYKGPG